VFFIIKNKLRFVTVSLLLTSLVTVVSSASAEGGDVELGFSFTIPDCTVSDELPSWSPTIDPTTDGLEVAPGSEYNTVTAVTGFDNGYTDCLDGSMDVNGEVVSTIDIAGGEGWWKDTDCPPGYCVASEGLVSVSGHYDVPGDAILTTYSGTLNLTWTPE
jgi:hypothetical protein